MSHRIDALLTKMVEEEASDLMLKAGSSPAVRVHGSIRFREEAPLSAEELQGLFDRVTRPRERKLFEERGEADLVYEVAGVGRFRGNIFRQRGYIGMVFRHIRTRIPGFDELKLPGETLKRLATRPRGLILVTGIAGSGKSTTIASMLEYLNQTAPRHIITIEDPIEYAFRDGKCVIEQREIGYDTESFAYALKSAVRQSPDVILIGEMRDRDTMEAALNAAETGHLVFSTLHSPNAMQTLDRVINMFDPHQHEFLKLQLAILLEGVVSQRLIPTRDGSGRVPAIELMIATPTVRELLMQGKTRELYKAIKEGGYYGCLTFNQSLKTLLDQDLITLEDALNAADSPDELKLELKGISREARDIRRGAKA